MREKATDGWTPQSEIDPFMGCPICGKTFDMRDLSEVLGVIYKGKRSRKSAKLRRGRLSPTTPKPDRAGDL